MTDPYRLPGEANPRHYRLVLEPDIANATFAGTAAIDVDIVERTDRITLNAIDLEIQGATITVAGDLPRDVSIEHHPNDERIVVILDGPVDPAAAVLDFAFTGELNDQLRGFYLSTFTDDEGNEQKIATTQFQSTDARRAFPCFDEPAFKASFGATLVVSPDHLAISNSDEIGREPRDDGKVAVHFADTIPMSTYLVAFVVGPLVTTDPVDVDGVALRVVHRPGQESRCAFALDVAEKALRYFTDYYALPYPGTKCDLVAIPDFAFGAMENLGCVTFREIALLADPSEATQPELQRIADVINHELAHMWFGDLVTMRWWNGIWLNEAFATFMETKATDLYRPDWKRWVDFGLAKSAAYDIDALASTRPVEFEVTSPAEAESMFDTLTYEKGASVVRMLEQYLGEDRFRDGIRRYLDKHQLDNTETGDLWEALEETTGEPVHELMNGWIFQGGVPVVEYDRVGDNLELRQRQFRYLDAPEAIDHRWQIPLQVRIGDDRLVLLLDGPAEIPAGAADKLPVLNADSLGYYRVEHDQGRLAALTEADLAGLSALERYVILDDMWALVLADRYRPSTFLRAAHAYRNEPDGSIWQRLTGALGTIRNLTLDEDLGAFQAAVASLVGPAVEEAGWTPRADEDDRTRERRATLLIASGVLAGNADVQAGARRRIGGDLPPELEAAAVRIVAASGDDAEFDAFWQAYQNAEAPQLQRRYLQALTTFPAANHIATITERCLGDDVRTQDAPFTLAGALAHRDHGPAVWEAIKQNWDAINERFPTMTISRLLSGVRGLATIEHLHDIETFLAAHPIPQGALQIEQHLERLRVNVRLRDRLAAR